MVCFRSVPGLHNRLRRAFSDVPGEVVIRSFGGAGALRHGREGPGWPGWAGRRPGSRGGAGAKSGWGMPVPREGTDDPDRFLIRPRVA